MARSLKKNVLFVTLSILLSSVAFAFVHETGIQGIAQSIKNKPNYYVDQISNVDSSADKGTHSNFTAQKNGPDSTTDILTENNTSSGSGTLMLYVDATDLSKTDWTEIGTTPYLDAIDWYYIPNGNLISTNRTNDLEGDFGFSDSGKSAETIISVEVQIYGMDSWQRSLEVHVWNGSSWISLGSQGLPTAWGWVNYTATTALGTWAKIDGAKMYLQTKAGGNSYYSVDCAGLKVNYSININNEADIEVQWTNIDYSEANEELCIYGSAVGSESLQIDVWDGSAWQNVIANLNNGWNNVTVSAYLTSSTFTIRFKGSIDTADAIQDNWSIDVALLHVWT